MLIISESVASDRGLYQGNRTSRTRKV